MSNEITINQFETKDIKPSNRFSFFMRIRIALSFVGTKISHWYHLLPKNIQVAALSTSTIAVFLTLLIAYPTIAPMVKLAYFRATGKEDAIFQNYYSVRSQNALAADNALSSANLANESDLSTAKNVGAINPNYYPQSQDSSNIVVTKTQTKTGNGVTLCPEYDLYYSKFTDDQLNEYAYFQNYYLSKLTTKSGQVIEFYLTNQNGSYEYRGGSYAIYRESMEELNPTYIKPDQIDLSVPILDESAYGNNGEIVKDTLDTDTVVSDIGESEIITPDSYQLLNIDNIDGKDYFVYQYSYDYYCPTNNPESNVVLPAIQKTWVDPESYMTLKDILYLNTVSENNMVYETTTSVEELDPSLADQYFSFDLNVEIKTIPYVSDTDIFTQWLDSSAAHALIPTDDTYWAINNISSSEAYNDFYSVQNSYTADRNYYAPGPIGDYYFDLMGSSPYTQSAELTSIDSNMYLMSKLDIGANNVSNGNWLNTSMYGGNISLDALREYIGLIGEGYSTEEMQMTIDGEIVGATKIITNFENYYEIPGGESSLEPVPTGYAPDMPKQGSFSNYYYHIIFQGNTYLVSISGESQAMSELTEDNYKFNDLDTQILLEREQLLLMRSKTESSPSPMPLMEENR